MLVPSRKIRASMKLSLCVKNLSRVFLIAFVLAGTACTKKRTANLPEDVKPSIFSIADFGEINIDQSQLSLITDNQLVKKNLGDSAKAYSEKNRVAISEAKVPSRLSYMFKDLEIVGNPQQSYKIVFSVDKQFVTAYKIVQDPSELSIIEKQIAMTKDEVILHNRLQKSKNKTQEKTLLSQLKDFRNQKMTLINDRKQKALVPLFKFKILNYGVIDHVRNELKEKTSTLKLKTTEWSEATHIEISTHKDDRIPISMDPSAMSEVDRTFLQESLNHKVINVGEFKKYFQVSLNLKNESFIYVLLDNNLMHIYEVGAPEALNLTKAQKAQLISSQKGEGTYLRHLQNCNSEVLAGVNLEQQAHCAMILRYDVPFKYVRPEIPVVDFEGNLDSRINFKEIKPEDNVGLIHIDKFIQPIKVESNNSFDPQTMIRMDQLKNKEFFFKRTLEDASVTTPFPPGMAGKLAIVKFEFKDNRIVVRKADKLIDYKTGTNDTDFEEILSFPVKYLKFDKKDSSGNDIMVPQLTQTSLENAEFLEVDWAHNQISVAESPYETLENSCFRSLTDTDITDVNSKLDQGVLSFSYNVTASLNTDCISEYSVTDEYNGNPLMQVTSRLKERLSFKLNDGSTDQAYVNNLPFKVQNKLGFGVWTIGKINPSSQGLVGRETQELNYPVVQDFRNGRKLVYTVTGLEPQSNIDPEIRQLYKDSVVEIVKSWDQAYRLSFKGTRFERTGEYLQVQFAGENGLEAKIGDLDKNIIHFENKFNSNHGVLGVSQVSYNPRSGVIVSDALVIYAGNLQQYVAGTQRNLRNLNVFNDKKAAIKKALLEKLEQEGKQGSDKDPQSVPTKNLAKDLKVDNLIKTLSLSLYQNTQLNKKVEAKKISAQGDKIKNQGDFGNAESFWVKKALKKYLKNPEIDFVELQALMAQEKLEAQGDFLRESEKKSLNKVVKIGKMRKQLKSYFKSQAGCMLTEHDSQIGESEEDLDFSKLSFKEALKLEILFDISHEMGHSQGLTHNFMGSLDKANFSDKLFSKDNKGYSSVMDYIGPTDFSWKGIGKYDIHALRAAHIGLVEVSETGKKELNNDKIQTVSIDHKDFVSIPHLLAKTNKSSWLEVNTEDWNKIQSYLKSFKYCTDIDLSKSPLCRQFDMGTDALEIVRNLIAEYHQNYIVSYFSWDRLQFGAQEDLAAHSRSTSIMLKIRQFLDEYNYLTKLNKVNEIKHNKFDLAAVEAYYFFNQVVAAPDTPYSFMDEKRFDMIAYMANELDSKDQPTGQKIKKTLMIETKPMYNVKYQEDRYDTLGYETDKLMAIDLLTLNTVPMQKYLELGLTYSFLDLEKNDLNVSLAESPIIKSLLGILTNQLVPIVYDDKAPMLYWNGNTAEATLPMVQYTTYDSVLNLEKSKYSDELNFAKLFKVGNSIGQAPSDRIALNRFDDLKSSQTRMYFWPMDHAALASKVFDVANSKYYFLQHESEIVSAMQQMITAQFEVLIAGAPKEGFLESKAKLIALLNDLNKEGKIISDELVQLNPKMKIENQVDTMEAFNSKLFEFLSFGVKNPEQFLSIKDQIYYASMLINQTYPLFNFNMQAFKVSMTKEAQSLSQKKEFAQMAIIGDLAEILVDDTQLNKTYKRLINNLELLSKFTLLLHKEYDR